LQLSSKERVSLSKTAEAAAVGRAIENQRRRSDRLFKDPFARGLVRPVWRAIVDLFSIPGIGAAILAMHERRLPGVLGNLLCRTRYIDDKLLAALSEGFTQIVILGSGLDSRAYRIPGIPSARVFEIDRRAVHVWKNERIQRLLGSCPDHVTRVECDLLIDNLVDVMEAAGLQHSLRTFFIWEGVSQYLTADAVDAVVRFAADAERGSRIVFTYIDRDVVNSPSTHSDEDRRVVSFVTNAGEPWKFGFDPMELPKYLDSRGLRMLEHLGATEYRKMFLEPFDRSMNLYEKEFAVVAEVM
jgi:methyltransferase (TIGR00027 family)